jgi:hypothetical protein
MAVKFLSKEWEAEMQKGLAEEFSTRGMVTTVFVQIVTDCPDGQDRWTLFELKKGKYVRYEVGVGQPPEYELAASGTYAVHKGCVTKELDGSVCITTGQMTLLGNAQKAMSLLGTYSRLEAVEQSIEVE